MSDEHRALRASLTLFSDRLAGSGPARLDDRLRRRVRRGLNLADAMHGARIDRPAAVVERLERQVVADDLDEHERVAGVEPLVLERRRRDVPLAQLRRAAGDEVGDPLLRLDALVEVLMPREDDVDAV